MQINFFTVNCKIFIKSNLKIHNNRVIFELIIMCDQFFICSFFFYNKESKIRIKCQVNKMCDFNSVNYMCVYFLNSKVHFSYFSAYY